APSELTNVNGTLFFRADDFVYLGNHELWKSDGTEAGTILVKDINPGYQGSSPRNLTNVNGTLFFVATAGLQVGAWKSDGTAAGAVVVKNVFVPSSLTNVNGTLFFVTWYDATRPFQLWRSDGTDAGTVAIKDLPHGFAGFGKFYHAIAPGLANVNGTLYI